MNDYFACTHVTYGKHKRMHVIRVRKTRTPTSRVQSNGSAILRAHVCRADTSSRPDGALTVARVEVAAYRVSSSCVIKRPLDRCVYNDNVIIGLLQLLLLLLLNYYVLSYRRHDSATPAALLCTPKRTLLSSRGTCAVACVP